MWFPIHQKLPIQDSDRVILLNGPRCQRPHSINLPNKTKQEDIKSKCHQQLSFELSPLNLPTAETETKSILALPNFSHLFLGGINFHSHRHSDTVFQTIFAHGACEWHGDAAHGISASCWGRGSDWCLSLVEGTVEEVRLGVGMNRKIN